MNTNDLKDKMASTVDKAKETAASAMDMASEAGRAVKAEVKTRATDTMNTVRDVAADRADAARDRIVAAGERLAETLQKDADATEGTPARLLNGLASGVTSATDSLRGQSFGTLIEGAKDYARRHPGTFALGAAVAGFALARFLRSSASRETAEARAAAATDRIYRDAARRTVDTLGQNRDEGSRL